MCFPCGARSLLRQVPDETTEVARLGRVHECLKGLGWAPGATRTANARVIVQLNLLIRKCSGVARRHTTGTTSILSTSMAGIR